MIKIMTVFWYIDADKSDPVLNYTDYLSQLIYFNLNYEYLLIFHHFSLF